MAKYQKFLIADFHSGLFLEKESWLTPDDAFTDIKNGYIHNGVVYKRKGYSEFGRVAHQETETTTSGDGVNTTFSGTFDNIPIQPTSISFAFPTISGTDTLTDTGGIFSSASTTASGNVDYTTGIYNITLENPMTSGTVCSGTYSYYPGYPITGVINYVKKVGEEELIITDTKRLNKYNTTTGYFDDKSTSDTWGGSENSYIHSVVFNDNLYLTNNIDGLKVYDGSTVNNVNVDLTTISGTNNELNSCLMCFEYYSRLVLLNTTEVSDKARPQRARWSAINDAENWVDDGTETAGYLDAATSEHIVSAGFVGNDLVVFFDNSIWKLEYVGGTDVFQWDKLINNYGSIATFSLTDIDNDLIVRDSTNMIRTNGLPRANKFDDKISNFILNSNSDMASFSYSGKYDEYNQIWTTYVSVGGTYSDRILVFNSLNETWSYYELPMNCFGEYKTQEDIFIDDLDDYIDTYEWFMDDRTLQAGYPIVIGGSRDGYIYHMNNGNNDNGSDITFELQMKQFNPWKELGQSCRFGYIEILTDADENVDLTLYFYTDTSSDSYKNVTLNCAGGANEDKVWVRAYVNSIAWNHSFKITQSGVYRPVIHAVRLAMKSVNGRGI